MYQKKKNSVWARHLSITSVNSKWVEVTSNIFYLGSLNKAGIESYRNS